LEEAMMRFAGLVAVMATAILSLSTTGTAGSVEVKSGTEPSHNPDISGWSDTRWGMGVATLRKLHPEMTIGKDNFGFTAGVITAEIAGSKFNVYLYFGNVGGMRHSGDPSPEPPEADWKLAEVNVYLETEDNSAVHACEVVGDSLRGKYGTPTKAFSGGETLWWITPTTRIIKSSSEAVGKIKARCSVRYSPMPGTDKL
jgi:hypothetical protein